MKNIIYVLIILFLYSCFEDEGNYTYTENEKISISNIEETYLKLFQNERLIINPEVESNKSSEGYEYAWVIEQSYYFRDTISTEKVLDSLVTWKPGDYTMTFSAKNLSTGYTQYVNTQLTVGTPYSRGWYVLKNEGDVADVDLYNDSLSLYKNIVYQVNGVHLKGQANVMSFYTSYYNFDPVQNRYLKEKVLFLMTDTDLGVIRSSDAGLVRDFDNFFFEIPEGRRPMMMYSHYNTWAFINDGILYSFSTNSYNNGRVGAPKKLNGGLNYYLSKYGYCDYMNGTLVFDSIGSTFYKATDYVANLIDVSDDTETEMSCINNGKELVYLGNNKKNFGSTAYAVMYDKEEPSLRMLSRVNVSSLGSGKLSITNDTLSQDDEAYNGEMFTISSTEEVLYFVSEGGLWSRNVGAKGNINKLQFDIPDGEEATFLRCIKYKETGVLDYNYLVLGTQIGDKYKIRFFTKTTAGNIDPVPDFTLPAGSELGDGRVGDIIYNSPKVNMFSYINTF